MLTGEDQNTQKKKKNLHQCHNDNTNPTWTGLRLNLDLQSDILCSSSLQNRKQNIIK